MEGDRDEDTIVDEGSATTLGGTDVISTVFTEPIDHKFIKQCPYADAVVRALNPYIRFMAPLLRLPLKLKTNQDGSYEYYYPEKSFVGAGFFATSVVIGIIALLVVLNTVGHLIDFPGIQNFKDPNRQNPVWGNHRYEEKYIFRRNVIPVIILITNGCHAAITSWNLYNKRQFAATYLTFWTEALEILQIDVSWGLRRYVILMISCYGGFMLLFTLICLMRFAPVVSGGPAILTMLTARCFYPAIHTLDSFWIFRGFGGIIFIYILIACRSFMLMFLILCRLMRNGFLVWNHRLDRVLHRGEVNDNLIQKEENRTGFDHLFKDHVCLLDLLEGADTLFSSIVESYYMSQLISTIFEAYYFYKSVTSVEDFKEARRLDALIIGLYMIHSLAVLFAVSIAAAEVGEEASEGLEIIRRRSMMGKKTNDELYFMLSMYTSYTGDHATALTGGRYFVLDKGLLVAMIGTILSYLIILSQFSPSLILTRDLDKTAETYQNTRLLNRVESTYDYFGLQVGF